MSDKASVERVERLVRIRHFEERVRRQAYASALQRETDAARDVEVAQQDVTALEARQRAMFESGRIDPSNLLDIQAALVAASERVDRVAVTLDRARRDRIAKEFEWRESRKRALALERLRDRRRDAWREAATRAERKENDEVALTLFRRSRAASPLVIEE
jgi:flagellar export protein FliJ